MRTKTLFLAAAALAAGIASSSAQSNVYSINIVGYVNKSLAGGALAAVATPLTDGTNKLSTVFAALPNNSAAYVWNGTGYTPSSKTKGIWSPDVAIPPGSGLFIKSAALQTNTVVGQVACLVGQTVTNPLTAGVTTMVGAIIPYAGDLTDTNLGLGPQLANNSSIYQWNGTGYTPSSKTKGIWAPNLTIGVGESVFVKSATTINWVQTLPAN